MFVADGHFDFDAIRIANKYGIYLVKVDAGGFQFIGKMSRDDFNNLKFSEY
jgi:hypothetical protein